ncbi:MAG: hypothetical protein JW953_03510 [Anaerolineae bacterium]|nr:hypothetical protein [Anaerolineae bacterium]
MSLLTKEELKTLSQKQDGHFVSIYMPTRKAGPETRENSIRLKNLVTTAEKKLVENGLRAPKARALLKPAKNLLDDHDFWQRQNTGLALFISANLFRAYRLPLDFAELVVVGSRFHLKPLVPLLSGDGRFYLLALSQNEVKLFQGTRHTFDEVLLTADVPRSLAEALWYEDPEKQQQFHTATATPGQPSGGRPAMFHGHGVGTGDDTDMIRQYCQKLNRGLADLFGHEKVPLILAGVDYLFPIYQEANSYPYLIDEGVSGNPENMSREELHRQAWQIIRPYFEQAQKDAFSRYHQLTDTDQISRDIREIVPAAQYAQVDTLFAAAGQHCWGSFDPEENRIVINNEPDPQDEDLLDLAVVQTLLHGGTVYAMSPDRMPDGSLLAAIFRFEKSIINLGDKP